MNLCPKRLAVAAALALAILVVPGAASAQDRAANWQQIQAAGDLAFAKYTAEGTAAGTARAQLRRQRMKAFDDLFGQLAGHIRRFYPEGERKSPRFAFAVFTLALYAELSGDLWYARDYYREVCDIIEAGLVPAGAAIPQYNGASIYRLSVLRGDRLGTALSGLPRPTVATFLFSVAEPGVDDFTQRIEARGDDFAEDALGFASYQARSVVETYTAQHPPEEDTSEDGWAWSEGLLRAALAERTFPLRTSEVAGDVVLGVGVDQEVVDRTGRALAQVTHAFDDIYGPERVALMLRTLLIRGEMSAADAGYLDAVISQAPQLTQIIGPPPGTPLEIEDLPLLIGMRHFRKLDLDGQRWANVTMLEYDGQGIHSVGFADSYLRAVDEASGQRATLPIGECPSQWAAQRFCILQAGLFARFLDSRASATRPDTTALRAILARDDLGPKTADEVLAMIERETGLSPSALRARFLDFAKGVAVATPDPETAAQVRAEAETLGAQFSPSGPGETDEN